MLLHQTLVQVLAASGREGVVSISAEHKDLSREESPNPVSQLVVLRLNLRLKNDLAVAWQLRGAHHCLIVHLLRNLRHERLRYRVHIDSLVHDFLLKLGRSAHEGPRLRLYDGKLIDLLQLIDDPKRQIDQVLVENFGIRARSSSLTIHLLDIELLRALRVVICSCLSLLLLFDGRLVSQAKEVVSSRHIRAGSQGVNRRRIVVLGASDVLDLLLLKLRLNVLILDEVNAIDDDQAN